MKTHDKIIVTKLADGRYVGVAEAAAALGVRKQTIYMFASGWRQALGAEKRERLVVVDRTRRARR